MLHTITFCESDCWISTTAKPWYPRIQSNSEIGGSERYGKTLGATSSVAVTAGHGIYIGHRESI